MVQELDESFAALVLIGYHSKAGSQDNPLAHTLTLAIAGLPCEPTTVAGQRRPGVSGRDRAGRAPDQLDRRGRPSP